MMNYDYLLKQDLEIGSGSVEGAVRYVVAQRFDAAGMRWIRERAEALLQLR
ncbi:MAG: ISKra4 family transposase, partial [Planctomycetes bacterium]|nr:ISKra4 family transposase [Planctomycetota bacterium]